MTKSLEPKVSSQASPQWLSGQARAFAQNSPKPSARQRYTYYHYDTVEFCQRCIHKDSRVLLMGWNVEPLADQLDCTAVYLWEMGPTAGTIPTNPAVHRISDLEQASRNGPIDVVLLPYTLQFLEDIQGFLSRLRPLLRPETRIALLNYNFFWAPLLRLAQKMHLRMALPDLNWLNTRDVANALSLTRFDLLTSGGRCLIPFKVPLLSHWVNRVLAPLPGIRFFAQKTVVLARPVAEEPPEELPSVSVVVPARNEAGNLQALLDRLPRMGSRCEVIFVEGHSRDNTWEEIQRLIREHPRKTELDLSCYRQTGEGKADATRLGFSKATGDMLMILDADLSVQPEDLPHFYSALQSRAAEFLNGSRLVYKMESQAMQILNLFFNKLFALWISWLIGQDVKDTLCGTKVLWRTDYERIRRYFSEMSQRDPFGDFELLFGASLLFLKIADVPVRYKSRIYGSTNIRRFQHGWQLLKLCCLSWPRLK